MLKRYFWLLYLALVAVTAIFSADMVKAYLSARLMAPVTHEQVQAGGPAGPLTQQASMDQYAVIVKRNIFNANPPAEGDKAAPPPPPPPEPEVPPAPLELRLVGIAAGGTKQRYAIIEDTRNRGAQHVYHIGDVIQHATVVDIRPDCVILNAHGKRESLCFQRETNASQASTASTAKAPPPSPRQAAAEREPDLPPTGVVRVDNGTWRVSRELLMENFANLGALSTQARVVTHMVQGQANGFRLTQLKSGSLLQQIGLQNGDILQQVNGLAIHSPQEALQAYQQLQSEGTVRINILRQNRPTTLTYEIR
jgi:general secretion pathway protein C